MFNNNAADWSESFRIVVLHVRDWIEDLHLCAHEAKLTFCSEYYCIVRALTLEAYVKKTKKVAVIFRCWPNSFRSQLSPIKKCQWRLRGYAYMMPKVAYPSFTQTMVHLMRTHH